MAMKRDEFLISANVHKAVDIPGVGIVCLRDVTGEQFDYIRGGGSETDERGLLTRIVIATLCDENGDLLFKPADFAKVNQQPLARLRAVAAEAQVRCGITPDDADELLGNSETTTTSGSGTA